MPRCIHITLIFLGALCVVFAGAPSLWAKPALTTERTYAWLPYFVEPCEQYGVPISLALAIARQESGIRPWVINIEGKGYFPQSREEARAIADKAWAEKRSFDVGIMQVNSFWLKRYNIAVEDVLEPQSNIAMGVWILAREIRRYGLTWQAIGAYHTPLARNPERAKNYAASVLSLMRNICDTDAALRGRQTSNP